MKEISIPMFVSFITTLVTSCTFHVIDDDNSYDIEAVVTTPDCELHIKRIETKSSGERKVKVKP